MITHTFTHFKKSLILGLFFLMYSGSTLMQAQSISYECSCQDADPSGLLTFIVNTWGCAPGDQITLQNGVNLLDANGNPLPSGTPFTFVTGSTFTLQGFSDPNGPVPVLTIFKNGMLHFSEYELFSCRAPAFNLTPANPTICAGELVTLLLVDDNNGAPPSQVTWSSPGADNIMSVSPIIFGTNDNLSLIHI